MTGNEFLFLTDSRSPAPTDEPSQRKHLVKRSSYQTDDDQIQHIPGNAWSTKMTESSNRGAFNQTGVQLTGRKQEATYLSRHLHGSHSPNSTHEIQKSTSRGSKIRSGWSPEKSHELLPSSISTAWQEEAAVESKDHDDTEEENEQVIEKMVSEYSNHQSNGMREIDQGISTGQLKAGAGRDRFTLHGWAATFLQQPTDVQLPKGKVEDTRCFTFKHYNISRSVIFGRSLYGCGAITYGARAKSVEVKFLSLCMNFLCNF